MQMQKTTIRLLYLIIGIILSALGIYMTIQANVGLAPWDAFSVGISNALCISVGSAATVANLLVITTAVLLKEKVGLGTISTTLLIGPCIDLFYMIDLIPSCTSYAVGIPLLLLGQCALCVGSYFYISPGYGCGPRDSLTVAMGKRFHKAPIGLVRFVLDSVALLIGWLLRAKAGIGTLISVLGYAIILQYTFRLFRFDIKAVTHQSIYTTWMEARNYIMKVRANKQATPPDDEQRGFFQRFK